MPADIFISYAWTTPAHREWTRLLASHMHLIGYNVEIDANVHYGSNLHGFMRTVTEARHVLVVADENYVRRANEDPNSGVAVENEWIKSVYTHRSPNWLSVAFVNNPNYELPHWLKQHNPKGFSFNVDPEKNDYPGSEQIEELWRWIEDLPADKSNATPLPVIRQRARRLESIANLRDPGNWANPALTGDVHFKYRDHERGTYTLGHGECEFSVFVSGAGHDTVYFLSDYVAAVGLAPSGIKPSDDLASFLSAGRAVTPRVGQTVILMNKQGILCSVILTAVQDEVNSTEYVAPYVRFSYTIHSVI